jgi:class 3 adenylate cyclase
MRRRLTTLFVDIAGSTRLVVRHQPETMLGVVQCFAELVTGIALRHRGRVKDFEGDGVLLYFESTVDAAEAALAIHAALAEGFRLLDPAFEVPGADGLVLAVYALEEPAKIVS